MLYQDYRIRARGLDDSEAERLVDKVDRQMRVHDPEAMDNAENYWPLIVEQMRQALL